MPQSDCLFALKINIAICDLFIIATSALRSFAARDQLGYTCCVLIERFRCSVIYNSYFIRQSHQQRQIAANSVLTDLEL